jgi:hypothetical protein
MHGLIHFAREHFEIAGLSSRNKTRRETSTKTNMKEAVVLFSSLQKK